MSLDAFKPQQTPAFEAAPRADSPEVLQARRRARARAATSGRRGTILGGRAGGAEMVAVKSLLGE